MSFISWLQNFTSARARQSKHNLQKRRTRHVAIHRPNLEALEDRCVPAFLTPVYYSAGPNPTAVVTADFNRDGHLDLATANLYGHLPDSLDSDVSILLGNPDGSFQAARNYAAGVGPDSIAVGDFNGDGQLDLVTGNLDSAGKISVLLGNGDGNFPSFGQSYTLGTNTRAVAVGDFNADGKLDVAATGSYDAVTDVDVLLGHGDGSFAPTFFLPNTGGRHDSLATGDFNRDGYADLAWAEEEGTAVDVLLSNGDGTFQAAQSFATAVGSVSVVAADLNGDGKLDLVTGSPSVLLGNGDGTFQAAQNYADDNGAGGDSFVGDFKKCKTGSNCAGNGKDRRLPDLPQFNYSASSWSLS